MKILVTGGAGFVGSHLCRAFKARAGTHSVVAFDNLRRRGSEINVAAFKREGIAFVHGDVRNRSDLEALVGNFDVMIEASAEPSVLAGLDGSPSYLLETNLGGTLNCLELARKRVGATIFLSTSRVYSIQPLAGLSLRSTGARFELDEQQATPGVSSRGIAEEFPVNLPRSLYGATKLASEMLVQEYVDSYKLNAVINRCGVICGPGQFGKVDQGVFTLWVANHYFRKPLRYTGFGGLGLQVRDLLHPSDLFALIEKQLAKIQVVTGETYNVGGGRAVSTSLAELTRACQVSTGNTVPIESVSTTAAVDIPWYISDSTRAATAFDWAPARTVQEIVAEITDWLRRNEATLQPLFD